MRITPGILKWGLNIYGPYLGAGIKVNHISKDWRHTKVTMKLKWFNRNFVGVHFGGSLYSMADPHYMLMLMQILGKEYLVWDKSARIEFIKPGKGKVSAEFTITDEDLETIRQNTANGEKYFHTFHLDVVDSDLESVARVEKVLYIKKKK